MHLKSVFQAITKASEDTENVITAISKRHVEMVYREKNSKGSEEKKLREMREKIETELKHLHLVLSDISQSINASQNAMECCIFATDPNLDTYDSTADWEVDTLDDDVESFDSKLEHFVASDSEESMEIFAPENPLVTRIAASRSASTVKIRKKRKSSLAAYTNTVDETKRGRKSKRMKRAKSVKKMGKVKHSSTRRPSTDALLKDELNQLDKDQLLELALQLKNVTPQDNDIEPAEVAFTAPESPPESRGGMSKQLKHRIPSKTRLRISGWDQ